MWLMPTFQSLHHIKGARLDLFHFLDHTLLLHRRRDAVKQAYELYQRNVLKRCISLITPHGTYTLRVK